MDRVVYTLRNTDIKPARYRKVADVEPLIFSLYSPSLDVLNGITIDDLSHPSYSQSDANRQEFDRNFKKILLGSQTRWKLWEAKFYRDRLLLNYLDLTAKKHAMSSAIAVTIPYCDEFRAQIYDPVKDIHCEIHYTRNKADDTSKFVLGFPADPGHYHRITSEILRS